MLLQWKGAPAKVMKTVIKKCLLGKIVNKGTGGDDRSNIPTPWTKLHKKELQWLKTMTIVILKKKRDTVLAIRNKIMSEERVALMKMMMEMKVADNDTDVITLAPKNITPV